MPKDSTPNFTCALCGKQLRIRPYLIGRKEYCSSACGYASRRNPEKIAARFWAKVDRSGEPDACWLWQGLRNEPGYGLHNDKRAHRIAWEFVNGPIPDGLFACHDCPGGDNRACCNPSHLFLGTAKDNAVDMSNKGKSQRGVIHWAAKLTDAGVREIRRLAAESAMRPAEIAVMFSVSTATIHGVLAQRSWKHVR